MTQVMNNKINSKAFLYAVKFFKPLSTGLTPFSVSLFHSSLFLRRIHTRLLDLVEDDQSKREYTEA